MENTRVLTIMELLQGGSPITATYYPHCRPSSLSTNSSHSKQAPLPSTSTDPNPDRPNVLTPLDHPAIIIGTLILPTASDTSSVRTSSASNPTRRCSYNSCFQFTDGSATICCDIIDLDVRIIGKKIRVLAWNFIPIKRGGGFLEIIRWSLPDSDSGPSRCLKVDSFSLASGSPFFFEGSSKALYRVHGALESISPISVVPSTSGVSDPKSTVGCNLIPSTNLRGFLVQILVCECKFCSSNQSRLLQDSIQEHHSHSFTKPLFVYFCGSASSWHPVFTKLIGNLVNISGLKRKLVYIAKEESRLMYVTTEKSNLHLPSFLKKCVQNNETSINGKGECGTYVGIVRGVYMQGMVVEMDNEVWLLLTDQLLTPPHSLRVGALISVRNVHFVDPKFSWKKMLILGACFKTSISVEHFSPLVTGCHMLSQSHSMLGNFIGSLAFSARLWVLLLVSCFRQKFAGIVSEKEILGSKNKEGLVQMYASSHLPSSTLQPQRGIFMALCKHDTCGRGCQQYSRNLKLVAPIFSSICHWEGTWIRELQLKNENKILRDSNQYNLLSCEGRSYCRPIRKIFSSEDIGIILIGNLKISPSSGRLQLVDATGSIDVFIPDLPSTWNSNSIYEVIDYSLVIEGMPGQLDHFRWIQNELFSCRSIFNFIPLAREINLTVYVCFHLGSATCRNFPFYPRSKSKEVFQRPESGIFHLLYVTHKFPLLQKFQGDAVISDTSSVFVEALILSWNLFLPREDEIVHQTKNLVDQLKDCMQHCDGGNASLKRCKVDHESGGALSGLVDIPCKVSREFSGSNSYAKSNEKQSHCNLTSHEISCLAAIRGVNNHGGVHSVKLSCTRAILRSWGFCRPSSCKVMLEFKPESYHKYQLLRIGCYYITNHDREDSFCNLKDFDNVSGIKVLVTSTTHLNSLSFVPDGVLQRSNSSKHPPLDGLSCIRDEFPCKDHNEEVLLQMLNDNSLETCSDISLFLPANIINFFELNRNKMDENLVQPAVIPEGTVEASPYNGAVVPSPLLLPKSNCLLPEGSLISLRGIVIAAHGVDHNSVYAHLSCQNLGYPLRSKFVHGFASSSCFHVLIDNQIARISGAISKHAFPIGFGAGVDATFHRVLELGRPNRWMLTPVSLILINSIRVNELCSDKCSNLDSCMHDASLDTITSGLISKLVQCFDCKPMQSHCRVVAVSFLVLEKKKRTDVCLQSKRCSREDPIGVPLACFVLEDGSSSCCCWANAERAATLLRLHEKLPQRTFGSNDWGQKGFETDNSVCSPITFQLERILKNHDRITVKNYGSFFDSSYQDLAVSVSSENALSTSDESFLKLVVYNACFGTLWTIAASLMDSDTVRQLMKDNLLATEVSMHSMRHIWAKEVHYTNPCTEARNVIKELFNRRNCSDGRAALLKKVRLREFGRAEMLVLH
ncbi:hypothetical protein FNV43_RR11405 [Rhamnella rubrinervis]|uniref:CST complex subunit CTC1 n=1 Tax=Rhamnella rubrinervis TaxID=2594499 RepID=A0A8K0MHK8_9ROSA|nr:hypothetical protein FNV43_RR11405 [Rhamnella rubrinervis]